MRKNKLTKNIASDFLIFNAEDGSPAVKVRVEDETIWLTQVVLAELFQTSKQNISQHISKIFEEGELEADRTVKKFFTVQNEGGREVSREIEYYNLDIIIAVGYRVNSKRATQFRIWATQILNEYIKKGFVLDDDRLKQGIKTFGKDYFRELLERVRSIRASERRIWLQITDIFAECSIDYISHSDEAHEFYSMVQNKFHYAITGKTAAEIINSGADHRKPKMGLSTYKNAPDGRVLKSDVIVGKNYLQENEIKKLERTVSGFFDYIENIIENNNTFTMEDFAKSVDKFLSFNEYKILEGKGLISMKKAQEKAIKEYDIFNKNQEIKSDFEKILVKKLKNQKSE